jgi:hypothetical protein
MRQTRAWYWKGDVGYVLPPNTRMSLELNLILGYFRDKFPGHTITPQDITTYTFESAEGGVPCSTKSKPLVFDESAELPR